MTQTHVARVFVLVIDERPILAFEARNTAEARELGAEQWMREDLIALTSEGRPIWNGHDKIGVRPGSADEVALYHEADGAEDTEEILLVYLVALDGV
ncbi:MAG: hypothetical protein HY242_05490 [Afipia sp.]|nr:hypothetical protein [Afipia sp.]